MVDFAWSHYALVLIIALILLGPKEIPVVLRFVGRWVGKIRRHTAEWRDYIDHYTTSPPPHSASTNPSQSLKTKNKNDKEEDATS
jgi:sec-independent protein translocase protein TatB